MCNKDLSIELYNKYFSLSNKKIEVTLKNKTVLLGKIIGYFYEEKNPSSHILKWHIADVKSILGIDSFDFLEGEIIMHRDINSIYFYEDKSTMKF